MPLYLNVLQILYKYQHVCLFMFGLFILYLIFQNLYFSIIGEQKDLCSIFSQPHFCLSLLELLFATQMCINLISDFSLNFWPTLKEEDKENILVSGHSKKKEIRGRGRTRIL